MSRLSIDHRSRRTRRDELTRLFRVVPAPADHTRLQEFVARAGLQGTLQHLLPTPPGRGDWKAFIPGLFWGWLFSRQRIGVTVSHVLVGLWGIFALGVHAVIGGG